MENFKEQHPPNQPELNPQGALETKATTNNEVRTQAEEQESQQNWVDSESAELNALLKTLLDPSTHHSHLTNQSN